LSALARPGPAGALARPGPAGALAHPAWLALAAVASALATVALVRWAGAIALRGPVLYGEGAVAHAAVLARDGAEYVPFAPPVFVAANYTPLFFHLAGLGDPFVWGRVVSVACTLFVAGAIGWRARAAGPLVALALAAVWLALAPTAIWGPAVKPDLLALALTVGAVLLAGPGRRGAERAGAAGVLAALAVAAKPTAALPAAALATWLVASRRTGSLATYATAAAVTGALVLIATPGGVRALRLHVVEHNALPWSAEQLALLAVLGIAVVGVPLLLAAALRATRGATGAYLAGAIGVLLLGGREGATINYLLDVSAASLLALAGVAPRLAASALPPALLAAQVVAGAALLDPFGLAPGRAGTGAWGRPERIAAARALPPGPAFAEDAGLLVAQGREPIVDDLFLWARLAERGALDREPLVRAIRAGDFVRIVSEVDLAALDRAPAYERQRWPPWLAAAVLDRYELESRDAGLYVYRPR
jgi:hypothetical protein